MIVHLNTADPAAANAKIVGGKAASLARLYKIPSLQNHAPKSYSLSTAFFDPWLAILTKSSDYIECQNDDASVGNLEATCTKLKQQCKTIALNTAQQEALKDLRAKIDAEFSHGLAAVRSSATEEDGNDHSFAGIFETKLGVRAMSLESAVRECFASKFDARVMHYSKPRKAGDAQNVGFAVVVMEMIDSVVAGVAFSANPLNSDRDECVIDSSWGVGESVVDGSVTADRFIYDKVKKKLVTQTIGNKPTEKRIDLVNGSIQTLEVDKDRTDACSFPAKSMCELVELVCDVENEYGMPMDVEWAITGDNIVVLLQARPITTLFWLDDNMMTKPGGTRTLYYDYNIASEATTTTPFHHMDMKLYNMLGNVMLDLPDYMSWISDNPKMPMFNGATRQYINLSFFFKFLSPKYFAKETQVLDPYLSSIFASKDCSREKYRAKNLVDGALCGLFRHLRHMPMLKLYKIGTMYKKHPEKGKLRYMALLKEDTQKLQALEKRGRGDSGIVDYASELLACIKPSLMEELGLVMVCLLGLFQQLDKKRLFGKTEEERLEYEALVQGYEGDPLMELNIDMYRLANKLDESIWKQYNHNQLKDLADRIQKNMDGALASDLPAVFISEWKEFMNKHGYDGEDQLFITSPRYQDTPVLLLARLRQNVGAHVKDPSIRLKENVAKRKEVQVLQAERAKSQFLRRGYSKTVKRNDILDHLMWIRNAPKMRISRIYCILRAAVLSIEQDLIEQKRLDAIGDIFHLNPSELDAALVNCNMDLMGLIAPRKAVHQRALRATECPLLIDSRCRILRPDPPNVPSHDPGVIVGVAVAPGVATGRVRILKSPTDYFDQGEVLATTVTSPAWTPLFIGAAGIILQIGGVLQHGALCARECGKPACSNVNISLLKDGMMVEVDGNKGTVTILEEE